MNKFQQFEITVAELNQLNSPEGIFLDNDNSIYIADSNNHCIVKWKLNLNTGQIIAGRNIYCRGLTTDKNGFIYASDCENNEVKRWKQGDKKGKLVTGGNNQN
ncbi:unnamed protein product [Adineta steineri]|uniref:Uncharacterized protein n=1 Tax=Adineta steineri TaxID=433720 RepID=A0A814BJW4_9BILA|nr:unnamed protein product [Adineta steineri]CAF1507922.1 unnamed protein product [Adineta steineri]